MTNYVLTYHGGNGMPESQAEIDAVMAAWGAWFGQMGEAVVDGGNPVGNAVTIAADGAVTPGQGVTPLTGYSIISAADIDAATALAKDCPVLANGGSVQVSETIAM